MKFLATFSLFVYHLISLKLTQNIQESLFSSWLVYWNRFPFWVYFLQAFAKVLLLYSSAICQWEKMKLAVWAVSLNFLHDFTFCDRHLSDYADFSFSLKVGEVFAMSLVTSDCKTKPKCHRRRNPSYRRRQERRREIFLQKKDTPGVNLGGSKRDEGAVMEKSDSEANGHKRRRRIH